MHIAIVAPYFTEAKFGGAELWCREVALELMDRGHSVEVVTTNLTRHASVFEPKAPRRGEPWGIPTRRHRVSLLVGALLKPAGSYPLPLGLPFDPAFKRADLVLVSGVETATAPLGALGARLRRTPVLVMPHTHVGVMQSMGVEQRGLMVPLEAVRSVYFQCNTEVERPFWEARVGPRRVLPEAVGCGVRPLEPDQDLSRDEARKALGLPDDERVVLFLGRLHWAKGVLRAVEAVDRLDDDHPDAKLSLVGFLEDVPAKWQGRKVRLPEFLQERWPDGPYRLVGDVDEVDKHRWLAAADVLVLPSHHESFGIVLLEAWQHGTPVVGWDAGGMPTVIDDGTDGYVVSSIDELRDRVAELLADPGRAEKMGEAGRLKTADRYDWSDVCDRVLANVEALLDREAKRRDRKADRTTAELREVLPGDGDDPAGPADEGDDAGDPGEADPGTDPDDPGGDDPPSRSTAPTPTRSKEADTHG